jgi:Holliday junction resolvase RusA-like endonuclease
MSNDGVWRLFDSERPWTANAERRWHHYKRAQVVRDARARWAWHALAARVPRLDRVEIDVRPHSKDRRWKPDVAACYPAVKAAIDGLVDARVLEDDDDRHVVALRFLPVVIGERNGLEIVVTELGR